MPDKKLQKFKDIYKLLQQTTVDHEDFAEFKKIFISSFKEIKQTLDKKTIDIETNTSKKLNNHLQLVENEMEKMIVSNGKEVMSSCHDMMEEKIDILKNDIMNKMLSLEIILKRHNEMEVEMAQMDSKTNSGIEVLKTEVQSLKEELKEVITKIEDSIKQVRVENAGNRGAGVRRVYQPYVDDFSAQTNGVKKTFYLSREPLKSNAILVWGSDFPIILRPTTDFTVSGKALTLTVAIPAPSTGATLLIQYHA